MKIGIIGLGLMGGSFGRVLVKKTNHTVYGYDINENAMKKGEMLLAYHERLTTQNAKELDMLVVSVYPKAFKKVLQEFLPHLKNGAIITDFCGTKRNVASDMREFSKIYDNISFIGGHPMAGREFSGIEKSSINLFEKASMILVNINADIFTMEKVKKFYLDIGFGGVVITSPENHDKMISFTSQLCHIVSNAFIKNQTASEHLGYSAGSYKDLTRVARLNPTMWTQLMLDNSDYLSSELGELIENLQKYQTALIEKDEQLLYTLLQEGNERKILIDNKGGK